jgi:folate-dependent phosphoribosylglycinamide formyltransferase PurN
VTSTDEHGSIVIVTNGNFFARLILGPLIRERHSQIAGIVIITGVRAGRSRRESIAEIRKRGGWRHFGYKVATYVVFSAAGILRPRRRYFVHEIAREHGIPLKFASQVNSPAITEQIRAWQPELLVSVSCPQRIGLETLSIPTSYAVNIHSSLLPAYAGISPYFWVLVRGEERTGTTVHVMREKFDSGAILVQKSLDIRPRESVFSLFYRLSLLGGEALSESASLVLEGKARPLEQDASRRSYYSSPTAIAVTALRRRGHRFARCGEILRALRETR